MFWFLFYRNCLSIGIKLHNAKPLRVIYIIAKNCGSLCLSRCFNKMILHAAAIEYIISKNHGTGIAVNKILTKNKSLGKSIRRRLNLIGNIKSQTGTISKKPLKIRQVIGS